MASADLDETAVAALEPLLEAESVGVLVGAGASVAAGLPDWNELSERLLVQTGVVIDEAAAERFLARQDPQLAAEAARNAAEAQGQEWTEVVRQALYRDGGGEPDPSPLHFTLASLAAARQRRGMATGLFTLNFDQLLEDAIRAGDAAPVVHSRSSASDRAGVGVREVNHCTERCHSPASPPASSSLCPTSPGLPVSGTHGRSRRCRSSSAEARCC